MSFDCTNPLNQAPILAQLWNLAILQFSTTLSNQKNSRYKRIWTQPDVERLMNTCMAYSRSNNIQLQDLKAKDFEIISRQFKQTTTQCMAKFQEVLSAGTMRTGAWSQEEDQLLIEMIGEGRHKWGKISKELNKRLHKAIPVRSGKKCKERWIHHLDPSINRGQWTEEEDSKL